MTQQDEASHADDPYLSDEALKESGWTRFRRWLKVLCVLAAIALIVRAGGDALYNPPSRLPEPLLFTREQNLLGATRNVLAELELTEEAFPDGGALDLRLVGEVYELAFPRTFGDRLFNERRERATVFAAESSKGRGHRFLILSDGKSSPVYAVESERLPYRGDGPTGIFVGVPAEPPFATLTAALATLRREIERTEALEYSFVDFTLFGPFARGDREAVQRKTSGNVVLEHLIEGLEDNRADVSLTPALFLITKAREEGVVRAIYQPYFGAIMEPPWEDSQISTLAHELVHAFIDRVERERNEKLSIAADHFGEAHPRLYGEVISELYSQLDRRGRAEEALANIVGAVAGGETRTVEAAAGLRNQSLAEIAEPILSSDLALLVEFGLLPECMDPDKLGYQEANVTFAYYNLVRNECT